MQKLNWFNFEDEDEDVKRILRSFKKFLLKKQFPIYYNQMLIEGFNVVPFPTRKNENFSNIFPIFDRLFFKASSMQKSSFDEYFGNLGEKLVKIGLFGNKNNKIFSFFRVIFLFDSLIMVPYKKYLDQRVYLGADSLSLANKIQINSNDFNLGDKKSNKLKIIDLFTGSGIQLLNLKNKLELGVGVDILDDAINTANLNSLINDVDDKLAFINSDLSKDITFKNLNSKYGKFDILIANPPIIPMPSFFNTESKIHSFGGEDGLIFVRKIIENLPSLLELKGQTFILAVSLGDEDKPFFYKELKDLVEKEFNGNFIISKKIPIELDAYYRSITKDEDFNKWIEFYKSQKASYWYRIMINLEKNKKSDNLINLIEIFRSDFEKKISINTKLDFGNKSLPNIKNNYEIIDFLENLLKEKSYSTKELAYLLFDNFNENFKNIGHVMRYCGILIHKKSISPQYERFTW